MCEVVWVQCWIMYWIPGSFETAARHRSRQHAHGDHETPADHRARVDRIRSIEQAVGKPLAILQDLPGPKIRIGTFQDGPIHLSAGSSFTLTTEQTPGDQQRVSVNYPLLADEVSPGQHLLLADERMNQASTSARIWFLDLPPGMADICAEPTMNWTFSTQFYFYL